ncbi:MAG: S1C family serine protease [Fimbriimonas sp.]
MSSLLQSLSDDLANAAETAGRAVVRVDDGTRLTASGVVWEPGVVVSTSHGVERDEDLAIETGEGQRIAATLVGRDPDSDLAVLRFEGAEPAPIGRAFPQEVRVGQLVLAVGRPGDAGLQVSLGVVGGKIPTVAGGGEGFLLQTDAVLYPGFSGGALVDPAGQFLGLTNLRYGRGRNFAVGVAVIAETVAALLAHGHVPRGYLGVRTQPATISETLRQRLSLAEEVGLLVVHLEEGSPAERGGLMIGDAILAVAGRPTAEGDEIRRALRGYGPGQEVTVRVLRGGAISEIGIVLGARE